MGVKEQIETELEVGSPAHCENVHRVDGVLQKHHSDEGPLWLLEIRSPCCNQSNREVLCDKVHTLIMSYMTNRRWRHTCVKCGYKMTFKEAYVGSIQWG